ncbi:hypothetical protein ACJX0J_031929, partial [Zea mays]
GGGGGGGHAAAVRRAARPLRGVRGRVVAPVRGAHRVTGPPRVPVPAAVRRGGVRVRGRRRRPRPPLRGGRLPLPHLRARLCPERRCSPPGHRNPDEMDGNTRFAAESQKKPIVPDDDLVELLWHNGSVVAQPQAHHRPAQPSDRDRPGTSGLTAEETAAWFLNTLDDPLEKDLYTQLWYNTIADAALQHEGTFPGPTSHPSSPPPPVGSSGVESSWVGDFCSTFCDSNQVPRTPTGIRGKDAALQSEVPSDAGAHDGTSSSGGSGSNYGGSGLPSDSVHGHKRKGMCRDESDSRSEATEETKPWQRHGPKRRTRAAEVHNLSERRRRDRIKEKMRALQELIPHCNK